jgi:soluble lytic murein transglycosylase-like protein
MSVADVVTRVQELQQLIHGSRPGAPAPPAGGFAAALAGVTPPAPTFPANLTPAPAGGVSGVPYADEINAAAARHGIDPALLAGLIRQESNFDPAAVSPAGARGLTQLMPATAAGLGVTDAADPAQAIEGGARYLKQQLDAFGNDPTQALAAYNAGPGAVARHGGVPPYAETQAYVRKVQEYADEYRRTSAPAPVSVGLSAPRPPIAAPRSGDLGYSTV